MIKKQSLQVLILELSHVSEPIWWALLGFRDFGDLGREEHHQNIKKKEEKASWNPYHDSIKELKNTDDLREKLLCLSP